MESTMPNKFIENGDIENEGTQVPSTPYTIYADEEFKNDSEIAMYRLNLDEDNLPKEGFLFLENAWNRLDRLPENDHSRSFSLDDRCPKSGGRFATQTCRWEKN